MERVEVEPGAVIVRQSEPSDCLYFILSGQAAVRIRSLTGNFFVLNHLGPDEYFGEIGLLTGRERTADVIATTKMSLLKLTKDTYMQYLSRMVEIEQQLAYTAVKRAANSIPNR
jgi:CRP-like cAMP-binding protein